MYQNVGQLVQRDNLGQGNILALTGNGVKHIVWYTREM